MPDRKRTYQEVTLSRFFSFGVRASSKLRGMTAFLFILVAGLSAANGVQAHGGHIPTESELLHHAWHAFATLGIVGAILLVLGVFFVRCGITHRK